MSDDLDERDEHGDLTDWALACAALVDHGCDCGTDEPGTCLGCVCERAMRAERAKVDALTAENKRLCADLARMITEAGESMRGSGLLTAMNDDLTAENARLRGEVEELAGALDGTRNALRLTVADLNALTAENARLRVEVEVATALVRDVERNTAQTITGLRCDLVDAAALHLADEQGVRNCERRIAALTAEVDDYRARWVGVDEALQAQTKVDLALREQLARVTGERDGLLAAAKMARHELTMLHGLLAFDSAAPRETWSIDTLLVVDALDAACTPPEGPSTQCAMCHGTKQVLVQGVGMVEIRPCPACAPPASGEEIK